MGRIRDVLALVAWSLSLVAAEAGLAAALATLDLPGAPDPRAWAAWLDAAPPEAVAVAAVAVAAAATGGYLVLATLAAILAGLAGASPARAVRRWLPAPLVHGLARRAVGAGLAASVAIGPVAPAVATSSAGPVPGLPWLERGEPTEAVTGPPAPEPSPTRAPGAEPPGPPRAEDPPAGWIVSPGDHFWSIAERVLAAAWERSPTDAQIVPYWRELIAANADRLVVPGDPDLILPGQRFVVPAPPAVPR